VGALGSHTALFLRNYEGLVLVDFDKIESKNILSQFHTKQGLGKNKANALQFLMKFLFGTETKVFTSKLEETNQEQLLGKPDLIIDCVDNGKARRIIQNYVRKHSIPCLHAGVTADGTYGRVYWDEIFKIDEDGAPGQATCENGEHLPFLTLVAAKTACEAQRFLEKKERANWNIHSFGSFTQAYFGPDCVM